MFAVVSVISKVHTRLSGNSKGIVFPGVFKQCFCQGMLHLKQPVQRIQTFSNWRAYTPNSRTWSYNTDAYKRIGNQQMFKTRPNIFQFFRNSSVNPLTVNTKVTNNVMLYKYERPFLYKGAFLFSIAALIGCLTMADNVYLILVKDLFNAEIALKERLLNNIFSLTAMAIGLIAGPLIMIVVWYITKRSVKYVILHKGGQAVTFVNYHPIKGETRMTVPAKSISCKSGRTDKKGYIPIKLKNHKHHFIIDKAGNFVNPDLFDTVVATSRFE